MLATIRPLTYDPAAPDEERIGAFDLPFSWEIVSR